MPNKDCGTKHNHIYPANDLENIETNIKENCYFTFVNRQFMSTNWTYLAMCYPILHTFLVRIRYTFAIKNEFLIFY